MCSFSFGHGGEIALNYKMRQFGGFEGNAQTLRIVARLEPYTKGFGMNLTRRTMLGFVKYPQLINNLWVKPAEDNSTYINSSTWVPAKGLYQQEKNILDWLLKPLNNTDKELFLSFSKQDSGRHRTKFKSLDCSIMELADDIAYGVHDLEDAIVTGMVSRTQWLEFFNFDLALIDHPWVKENMHRINIQLFDSDESDMKDAIGELVNLFITSATLVEQPNFTNPLLAYKVDLNAQLKNLLQGLKKFVYQTVIRAPEMQQIEFKGQKIIAELFSAFESDPMRLLPRSRQIQYKNAHQNGGCCMRVLADYISSMTDEYALKTHQRLFGTSQFS